MNEANATKTPEQIESERRKAIAEIVRMRCDPPAGRGCISLCTVIEDFNQSYPKELRFADRRELRELVEKMIPSELQIRRGNLHQSAEESLFLAPA